MTCILFAVNMTSGVVTYLEENIRWDTLDECQMAASISGQSQFYFVSTNDTTHNDVVVVFDTVKHMQTDVFAYNGSIWTIGTWVNSTSDASDRILLLGAPNSLPPYELVDLDLTSGTFAHVCSNHLLH
jgi:hypothetical protein